MRRCEICDRSPLFRWTVVLGVTAMIVNRFAWPAVLAGWFIAVLGAAAPHLRHSLNNSRGHPPAESSRQER